MTELFSLPPGLPDDGRGAVITVGTFDGVHRGHLRVLEALTRRARDLDARSVLVTFHPHPLQIVRPEAAPPLLTVPEEKTEVLAESGLDYAVFLSFTRTLAGYSPRRFVEEILLHRLRLTELIVGYDHGLGRGRSGDVETLQALGRELGFGVQVVSAVHLDGAPISSTRIRRALEGGAVEEAAAGLGRPYSLRGAVVRGDGRGRALGFPTANIQVADPDKLLPLAGVYAVRAVLPGDGAADRRPGVLHLGPRPTFRGAPPSVELHLFDFDGDLYGQELRVDFCARLRGVHAFDSVDELTQAIRRDTAAARRVFAEARGACQGGANTLE